MTTLTAPKAEFVDEAVVYLETKAQEFRDLIDRWLAPERDGTFNKRMNNEREIETAILVADIHKYFTFLDTVDDKSLITLRRHTKVLVNKLFEWATKTCEWDQRVFEGAAHDLFNELQSEIGLRRLRHHLRRLDAAISVRQGFSGDLNENVLLLCDEADGLGIEPTMSLDEAWAALWEPTEEVPLVGKQWPRMDYTQIAGIRKTINDITSARRRYRKPGNGQRPDLEPSPADDKSLGIPRPAGREVAVTRLGAAPVELSQSPLGSPATVGPAAYSKQPQPNPVAPAPVKDPEEGLPKPKTGKEPSKDEFLAYHLHKIQGVDQTSVARRLSQEHMDRTGEARVYHQGTVSRMVTRVTKWLAAGHSARESNRKSAPESAPKLFRADPSKLNLGPKDRNYARRK
jgi:hypothetical protein